MKAMIDGVWRTDVVATPAYREAAERSRFRDWVSADDSASYRAAPGRYHLCVSYACPFAHRTLLGRALLALDEAISISVLDPDWGGPLGCLLGTRKPGLSAGLRPFTIACGPRGNAPAPGMSAPKSIWFCVPEPPRLSARPDPGARRAYRRSTNYSHDPSGQHTGELHLLSPQIAFRLK